MIGRQPRLHILYALPQFGCARRRYTVVDVEVHAACSHFVKVQIGSLRT